jgi:SsrA-binding protein
MAPAENAPIKIVAENRKARHDYLILEQFEAGMVLTGTEVQSMRLGKVNLKDAYAKIKNGEIFLYQVHIGPYPFAYYNNHEPLRTRKLLLHRREINRLFAKANEQGHTLVPLRIYFKKGKAKVVMDRARKQR